mmetsp:Transcript_51251/g.111195  ORF Transcript_51251/g.111195 Transcript_51251/m.111195 type:complete len:574 (+) Transcript_51251:1114-2835(+)
MRKFIDHSTSSGLREKWLKALPPPRSTTILVECIREDYQSDEKVKELLERLLGASTVETAYIVRQTEDLKALIQKRDTLRREQNRELYKQQRAEAQRSARQHAAKDPTANAPANPRARTGATAQDGPELKQLNEDIQILRRKINEAAIAGEASRLSGSAFVTFKHRRYTEVAQAMRLTSDEEEFRITSPPDPADVIYEDLIKDPRLSHARALFGYFLVAAVFLGYLPIIGALSTVTSVQRVEMKFSFVRDLFEKYPIAEHLYNGGLEVFVLNLTMSLIPLILATIFHRFMLLKSKNKWQLLVQQWYYYFLIVFVLLVTTIGTSLADTSLELLNTPTKVFVLLASYMPQSTHFYMRYLVLQCAVVMIDLLRPASILWYWIYLRSAPPEEAKRLSEPEDQNTHGMGVRSARATFLLVVALVFCSLAPFILVIGTILFGVMRLVYGYLVAFVESRKPDMGGAFWPYQLQHVQEGIFIYVALMTGVLLKKASTRYPAAIAASAILFQAVSYYRFRHVFRWHTLPLEHIENDESFQKRTATKRSYMQDELLPEGDEEDLEFALAAKPARTKRWTKGCC